MNIETLKTEKIYITKVWHVFIIYDGDFACCYLCHDAYAPMLHMFDVCSDRALAQIHDLCIDNVFKYIDIYCAKYEGAVTNTFYESELNRGLPL